MQKCYRCNTDVLWIRMRTIQASRRVPFLGGITMLSGNSQKNLNTLEDERKEEAEEEINKEQVQEDKPV